MIKKKYFLRYFFLFAVFIFAVFVYSGALLNMQFARAEEFRRGAGFETYTKTFVVPALRGEIFDRNGVPLVTNENIYDIMIDGKKMPRKEYAGIIIELAAAVEFYGGTIEQDTLPVMVIEQNGEVRYSYSMDLTANKDRLDRFLKTKNLNVNISAEELVVFLTSEYRLDEYMPPDGRDAAFFRKILGICYEFERRGVLLGDNEYKLSSGISRELMNAVMENSHNYPGAEARLSYRRVYHFPKSAPHILGTIGKIPDGKQDWYAARGYSLDAIVGRSGVEAAFEQYLRGTDGILERTYDREDNLVGESWYIDRDGNIREPVAGKNVYLTLDIKLQQIAEHSLEKTIDRIHALSKTRSDPKSNGADANAGAAAITDPNTGQVLAIATYPSYSMEDYKEKYEELAADTENSPLANRATQGLYEPGSVFKIVTSITALCTGEITPYTPIYDKGKYTFYQGYQPECWYYTMYGGTHGTLNVTGALEHSCNYFYYTVGQKVGIERLNKYSKLLGLGEPAGIETGETAGVLVSPESKEAQGGTWVAGDLLQASIGQLSLFSPLQMANMVATVVNGGTRYRCSLLLYVKEYGSNGIYYEPDPEISELIEISEANLEAVRRGMRGVIDEGTGSALFNRIPISVGGKTGTVQVTEGRSNNATFVAFAPYNNPKLSVSSVIEKGAHGSWAGFVAEDVIEYYLGYKTFEEAMDIPEQTETETEQY